MKRNLLTMLCLASGYMTTAQTISIPDPIFEQVLIDKEIDSDGIVNGMILAADAVAVTTLFVTSPNELAGFYIQDLTGIEGFINLENLTVENTIIEELNVSTLTKLKRLSCAGNMIETLDVYNNVLLEYLDISAGDDVGPINHINSIDLSNNPNFKEIMAWGRMKYINLKNGNNNPQMKLRVDSSEWGYPPDYIFGNVCIEVDDYTAAKNNEVPYSEWVITHQNMTYSYAETCSLSTDKFSKKALNIYPNPASDILHIETTNGNVIDKTVLYDLSGRAVKEYSTITTDGISVSNLEKGIYILQVSSGKNMESQKVIIN